MSELISTEKKILLAARAVFLRKGMDGARMQEIADEAGINKALLHYYYRSKEKLFEAVFREIFTAFLGKTSIILQSDLPIKDKLLQFVDNYMDTISANPFAPQFIINEINRDPSMMKQIMEKSGFNPTVLIKLFESQLKALQIDVRHFIVSLLAMCIFPYAARPLMETIYFDNDTKAYEQFLSERRMVLKEMMLKLLGAN